MDIGWQNNLTTRIEVKTTRSLAMSFANTQLTQIFGSEYIIGAGYRFENLPLFFESESGDKKALKSDLRITVDLSLRDNTTVLRKIVEETNETIAGQFINTIKTSADYRINEQVTIRVFFDRVVNAPKVSKTYRTTNSSFGFSVRFELVKQILLLKNTSVNCKNSWDVIIPILKMRTFENQYQTKILTDKRL